MNQRPLGPERAREAWEGVAGDGTVSQAADIAGDAKQEKATGRGRATRSEAGFGPTVVQGSRAIRGLKTLPELLLSVGEVAESLGLCRATVYRLCEDGELRHSRVGNSIRIAAADVRTLLEESGKGGGRK